MSIQDISAVYTGLNLAYLTEATVLPQARPRVEKDVRAEDDAVLQALSDHESVVAASKVAAVRRRKERERRERGPRTLVTDLLAEIDNDDAPASFDHYA